MYGKKYKFHYIHSEHFNSQKKCFQSLFLPQNLHHFHFLLSVFKIFETQLLCLATGHSSHFLWRNFNFGALWTIAHLAIEVDLGHDGDVLFCILRLHWNWTGQCFALDRTLDSILHRSRTLGRRAEFSQKERYFVGSRGRNWDQIEITLQQSRKKQENNRWRKKVIILGELQLYAMEKRTIFVWIACHLNVILTTRLFQILNLFCVFCDEVRIDFDDNIFISSTSSPRSNAFFQLGKPHRCAGGT